jgi:hypothetical protein
MLTFKLNGYTYRTNADASTVEYLHDGVWIRTTSFRVISAARTALGL